MSIVSLIRRLIDKSKPMSNPEIFRDRNSLMKYARLSDRSTEVWEAKVANSGQRSFKIKRSQLLDGIFQTDSLPIPSSEKQGAVIRYGRTSVGKKEVKVRKLRTKDEKVMRIGQMCFKKHISLLGVLVE